MQRYLKLVGGKLNFAVIGEMGAVHFWKSVATADCFIGFHVTPAAGDKNAQATTEKCWLLNKRCLHEFDKDGSDAQDRWLPLFVECNDQGDFNPLWELLEEEYTIKFGELVDTNDPLEIE
jgi:hypothetical protein